jgi:LPXTG-site transpeptidase (sortase) family protein
VLSPEQEYIVTEGELPDGWALDDIVCELVNQQIDDGPVDNGGEDEDPWDIDLENRKLSITLGTNQSAECTFINKTEGEGTIKVNKITYPETTEPAFDFTLGEDISFSLKHGETLEISMDSGSYTLTETPPADWYLLDAVCSSSVPGKVQRPAAINLELGETVTCNFINVPPNTIAVKKVVTVPSAAKFEFYGALNGIIGHNEFLVKPNVEVTGELMSVREKPKQGWKLISIKCVEKGNVGQLATMPHLDKREALIGLDEGEVVLCTFYNDPNPEQPDDPDPEPPTSEIPKTGFPIGHLTNLPKQTAFKLYSTTNITLKVPRLDLEMPILGIPQTSENFWDVTWLDNNVGYLEGSAYPTWSGNTVLTGHVWTADNKPGPFAKVHTLGFGDKIEIVAYGQTYVYEVRSSDLVKASDVDKMMKHEKNAWVTLVTCEDFNEKTGAYQYRRLVRAVLVDKY